MSWAGETIRDRHPDLLNLPNRVWVTLTKHNITGKVNHWARKGYAKLVTVTLGFKQFLQDSKLNWRRMDQREVKLHDVLFGKTSSLGSDDQIAKMAGKGDAEHVRDLANRLLQVMESHDLKAQLEHLKQQADQRLQQEKSRAEGRDSNNRRKTAFENARVINADRRYAIHHANWTDDWFVHDMVHGADTQTEGVASRFRREMDTFPGRPSYEQRDLILQKVMEETLADLDRYAAMLEVQQKEREEDAAKGTAPISPDRYSQVIRLGVDKARDYVKACIDDSEERARFAATYHLALNLPATIRGRPVEGGHFHQEYVARVEHDEADLLQQGGSMYSDDAGATDEPIAATKRKVSPQKSTASVSKTGKRTTKQRRNSDPGPLNGIKE